jgi:hypothetical protein
VLEPPAGLSILTRLLAPDAAVGDNVRAIPLSTLASVTVRARSARVAGHARRQAGTAEASQAALEQLVALGVVAVDGDTVQLRVSA